MGRAERQPKAWVADEGGFPSISIFGRSAEFSWLGKRGSLSRLEEEIWCQWHLVVFVRLKDNGAIGDGARMEQG